MNNATKAKILVDDDELTKPLVEQDVEEQKQPKKVATPSVVVVSSRPPIKQRGGCPCWCKCLLITFGVLFMLGAIATAAVYSFLADAVKHLTVTTPHAAYPIVEMTDAELKVVKDRVELFVDQLLAGNTNPTEPLVITQDEINGFIGHSDYLKGNMFVTLKEGSITEEYSLPTSMLPGGKGRYFVGNDYMKVDKDGDIIEAQMETAATHHDWFDGPLFFVQLQYLVNAKTDLLELYLQKGSIFGQVAPQDYIDQHENLLKDLYRNPDSKDVMAVLEGIEHVRFHPGKIVVQPKNNNN